MIVLRAWIGVLISAGIVLSSCECQGFERRIWDCSVSSFGGCTIDFNFVGHTYGRAEGAPPNGPIPDLVVDDLFVGSTDVDAAYDLFGSAHEYFLDTFGRDGANSRGGSGDGETLPLDRYRVFVNVDEDAAGLCGHGRGASATFTGEFSFCTGSVTPDIVGHELGHILNFGVPGEADGFTPRDVEISGESGAIGEAMSDFFGEALERFVTGTVDWLHGVGVRTGMANRSFSDPTSIIDPRWTLPTPDRYLSADFYTGELDSGGIHVNAGVLNKAVYLAVEGGVFNGYDIEGIGFDKVEQIWYRALTEYFQPGETFNDAYGHLLMAASDLYDQSDVQQVRLALQAVEMHKTRAIPEPSSLVIVAVMVLSSGMPRRRKV